MAHITIEDLSFTYPDMQAPALRHLSLSLEKGTFTLLCGPSGCGKTTLLRLLKAKLSPGGRKEGRIFWKDRPLDTLSAREQAEKIGFVMQNPETQIVTDKVWHELAFGLENLGLPPSAMKRRIGEMASFFGISDWFRRDTADLSGGQKQLLNLAAVMVMRPELLLLDEPTSQLDPIAAAGFLSIVKKINRELGVTVLMTEHRLEDVFPAVDRVAVLDGGRLCMHTDPASAAARIPDACPLLLPGLPSAVRIFAGLKGVEKPPLDTEEARALLRRKFDNPVCCRPPSKASVPGRPAVELRDVWFRYQKDGDDILRGLELQIREGEIFALLGDNGAGKSTLLSLLAGLRRPYRGRIWVKGKAIEKYKGASLYRRLLASLPQNPQTVFVHTTLGDEFAETGRLMGLSGDALEREIDGLCKRMGLEPLRSRHPYDLSGGEQQKAALVKLLLLQPSILLLDEPTKGIDPGGKEELRRIFRGLRAQGKTLILVTHDVEFAAETADRCALLFDGEAVGLDTPAAFFSENYFYTTAASRISRGVYDLAVTCDDVRRLNAENGGVYA